jgi:predicted GIY-YIG superfamily endonuclease
VGIALNVKSRLHKHLKGNGSKLMKAVCSQNIPISCYQIGQFESYSLAHIEEKRIKKTHNSKKYCPVCNPKIHNYQEIII